MDINERIAQWEKMTQADAGNAMGWFSLGNAYKDADRAEDAVRSLEKCIELDATYSRAYQLLGQVLIGLGREDQAGFVLTQGYTIAAERGDVMPQRAMGSLLQKIGQPLPRVETKQQEQELGENTVLDRRTGQVQNRLPDPPMRGPLGRFIYDHFGQTTWREWIGQGTKVINEMRLDFSNLEHQRIYDTHMMEWLGISNEEVAEYDRQQQATQNK